MLRNIPDELASSRAQLGLRLGIRQGIKLTDEYFTFRRRHLMEDGGDTFHCFHRSVRIDLIILTEFQEDERLDQSCYHVRIAHGVTNRPMLTLIRRSFTGLFRFTDTAMVWRPAFT